jgi:hypothetical protein
MRKSVYNFFVSAAVVTSVIKGDELIGARQARNCLRNKKLTFVGDSLTRYQYINLAHFITVGEWEWDYLNGTNMHEWDDWFEYFYMTSRLNGCNEICDCYRSGPNITAETREHHYYHSKLYNISISMHSWYGNAPIYAGRRVPNATDFKLRCLRLKHFNEDLLQFTKKASAKYNIVSFLDKVIGVVAPDILVLNQGFWPMNRSIQHMASIAAAARRVAKAVVWKTTTSPKNKVKTDSDAFLKVLKSFDLSIFDAYALTLNNPAEKYWDKVHFSNDVYSELNSNFLKKFVC